MSKPRCAECDKPIDGETAWLRPFATSVQDDAQSGTFVGTASSAPLSGQELPFHPACFEKRTGQKWSSK
jgi:hypothetical protein